MALRRWKLFFPAFEAIDTAIEAATEGCSRDKFRQARSDLVEMLCDAADSDGDVRAEGLCRLLDRAMAEALLTLGAVPVPVTPTMLATTDVAKAVGGLLRHEAGMVRALARGVLAQWRASIDAEEGAALDTLLQMLREHEVAAPVTGGCVKQAGNEQTGDAKRKHPGAGRCYREADDVKRQRNLLGMVVQHRPRKMEPAMKRSTDEIEALLNVHAS